MTALALVIIALCVRPAHAYVDPGIVGSLYQVVYVLVLGAVVSFVVNPFQRLKAFFTSLKDRFKRK